ncbi:MAG: hydrogenase maturation nickel metallochaperone HypA [Peptococcaceae bacterium]|nr:hydrogenase maturation nickel metallochaperone HypA [Peptococcaceae bacterium]
MHEYPITEQIVKIASEKAKENNARRVTRITLVVGEYSGFIGESIQMYFDIISKGTLCEGAVLEMENVKAKWRCPSCGIDYIRKPLSFACPQCGQDGEPTTIGKEFYVKNLEVET